jgi:hypothetical protein
MTCLSQFNRPTLNSIPTGIEFERPGIRNISYEFLSASDISHLKEQTNLHGSNRGDRAFVATELTPRF